MSYVRINTTNQAFTTLAADITDIGATTFTVDDGFVFHVDGNFLVSIGSEILFVGTIDQETGVCTDVERGREGTTPAIHDAGATVSNKLTAGTISMMFDGVDEAIGAVDGKLELSGGTMTGDIDMDGNEIQNAVIENVTINNIEFGSELEDIDFNNIKVSNLVIKNYVEEVVDLGTINDDDLEIDLSLGNVFKVKQTGSVTGINITGASEEHSNSFTLEIIADDEYPLTWMERYAIAVDKSISVSDVDNSYNSSAEFDSNIQIGDTIYAIDFTNEDNNGLGRVKSATTSKIIVDKTLITEEAGTRTIGRNQDNFIGAEAPAAPEPYLPKVFTFWSYGDPTRWRVMEVGEF